MNFTVAFTLLVSIMILLFFLPRIGVLGRELRQRKGLLLLLPPQLMGSLPYVRRLIQETLAESSQDTSGGSGLRRRSHDSSVNNVKG